MDVRDIKLWSKVRPHGSRRDGIVVNLYVATPGGSIGQVKVRFPNGRETSYWSNKIGPARD